LISGLIEGPGKIQFGPGQTTLSAGTAVTAGGLAVAGTGAHVALATTLSYAGAFSQGAGTELSINGGDALTLTGTAALSHTTIDGQGRLITNGATSLASTVLGGTVQWTNGGTLTETAQFTIGDTSGHKALFTNQAGGIFNIGGNAGIGIGSLATSSFANAGLLEKTAGAMSTVAVAIANTGTVEAAYGTLDLQNKITGAGTLKIDGGATLQADNAVANTQTIAFNGANAKLVLTNTQQFLGKLRDFGLGDKLDLRQFDPSTTTLAFTENGFHTQGVLTVTDGALQAKITLLGQYMASGFHKSSDGLAGGTFVTYTPQAAMALAPPHS
jgi:hypothetical protein